MLQKSEWVKFSRLPELGNLELLHAQFLQYQFKPHSHEEYVVATVERGAEAFHCSKHKYLAVAQQTMIFHPQEVHTGGAGDPQGWKYRALYIPATLFATDAPPQFRGPVIDDVHLSRLVTQTHVCLSGTASRLEQSSLLEILLAALLERFGVSGTRVWTVPGQEFAAIKLVCQALQDDPGRHWSLQGLAVLVGLSPLALLRSFRREVGLTPHEFQTQLRVSLAKRRLRTDAPIAVVAQEVGFCDQSHLNRHFKRLVGVTPGQYQNPHKSLMV